MADPTHCYLGTKSCGCFGFIAVDAPSCSDEIGKNTRWLAKHGGHVDRLTISEGKLLVAEMPSSCGSCKKGGKS